MNCVRCLVNFVFALSCAITPYLLLCTSRNSALVMNYGIIYCEFVVHTFYNVLLGGHGSFVWTCLYLSDYASWVYDIVWMAIYNIGWQGGGHPSMVHGWQWRGPEASSSSRAQRIHSSRQTFRFVHALLYSWAHMTSWYTNWCWMLPSWTPRARNIKLAPKCWWLGEWWEPQENSWSQGLLLHDLPISSSFWALVVLLFYLEWQGQYLFKV